MKILFIFVTIAVFLFPTSIYGETEPQSIDGSKYVAVAQIELRDSSGNLVSVTKAIASHYLPDPIVDEFLEQYEVKEFVELKGKVYELRQIVLTEEHPKDSYVFESTLLLQAENRKIEIFSGLNHAFQVKSGDVSTIVWTILRLSN